MDSEIVATGTSKDQLHIQLYGGARFELSKGKDRYNGIATSSNYMEFLRRFTVLKKLYRMHSPDTSGDLSSNHDRVTMDR